MENNNHIVPVHQLKFNGEDKWTKQFNHCSELWQKAFDEENFNEEQRQIYWDEFIYQRQLLELGFFN